MQSYLVALPLLLFLALVYLYLHCDVLSYESLFLSFEVDLAFLYLQVVLELVDSLSFDLLYLRRILHDYKCTGMFGFPLFGLSHTYFLASAILLLMHGWKILRAVDCLLSRVISF